MSNLALLNTDADIVHKMDFTDIIDLFAAAKTRKVCFKCFSKDLCIFGFHSHLFLNQKILLLSFQFEKNTRSPVFPTSAFLHVIYEYKAKVSSRSGAPNFSGAPGAMWS